MRSAVIGALVGIALAVTWSCTVNRKTDKLACSTQDQCTPSGRVCENGYCVVDPSVKLDAAIDAKEIDAFFCPPECNAGCTATGGICMIAGTGAAVSCPAGWNCTISCPTAGACAGITCTAARSCNVTCGIEGACNGIACGAADCTIGCTGTGAGSGSGSAATACGTVSCTTGACELTCTGSGACADLTCGTGACTESCSGSGACGNTSCSQSCMCNVSCNPLVGACGTMTCPQPNPNHYCADGMVPGAPCNSSVFSGCLKTCP